MAHIKVKKWRKTNVKTKLVGQAQKKVCDCAGNYQTWCQSIKQKKKKSTKKLNSEIPSCKSKFHLNSKVD